MFERRVSAKRNMNEKVKVKKKKKKPKKAKIEAELFLIIRLVISLLNVQTLVSCFYFML